MTLVIHLLRKEFEKKFLGMAFIFVVWSPVFMWMFHVKVESDQPSGFEAEAVTNFTDVSIVAIFSRQPRVVTLLKNDERRRATIPSYPASILSKSTADRYRPVSYPDIDL